MSSIVKSMYNKIGLNGCPPWMPDNIHYEVIMGSIAYGVSDPNSSDYDIYGMFIPKKTSLFPHLNPYFIYNFTDLNELEDNKYINKPWQLHHVKNPDENRMYDFSIYSIVQYFKLCADNNPNMIDSLFVPQRCVLHCSPIAEHLRTNRKLFLSKLTWHRFKGYAYSQLSKMRIKHETAKKLFDIEDEFKIEYENIDENKLLSTNFSDIVSLINEKRKPDLIKKMLKSVTKSLNDIESVITLDKDMKILKNYSSIEKINDEFKELSINLSKDIIPINNSELTSLIPQFKLLREEYPELQKITDDNILYKYLSLIKIYNSNETTSREKRTRKIGYDSKFAYHIIRLLEECQYIFENEDLDLEEKGRRELMKSIREGHWKFDRICEYFDNKVKQLENVYSQSKLRYSPNMSKLNKLLCECIEMHYGSSQNIEITKSIEVENIIDDLKLLLNKYNN